MKPLIALLSLALLFTGCNSISYQNVGTTTATLAGLAVTPQLQKKPEYIPVAEATATALLGLGSGTMSIDDVNSLALKISEEQKFTPQQEQFCVLIIQALLASFTDETGTVQIDIQKSKPYVTAFARGLLSAALAASVRGDGIQVEIPADRLTDYFLYQNYYTHEATN